LLPISDIPPRLGHEPVFDSASVFLEPFASPQVTTPARGTVATPVAGAPEVVSIRCGVPTSHAMVIARLPPVVHKIVGVVALLLFRESTLTNMS